MLKGDKNLKYQYSRRKTLYYDFYKVFIPYGIMIFLSFSILDFIYVERFTVAIYSRLVVSFLICLLLLPIGKRFFKKYYNYYPALAATLMNITLIGIICQTDKPAESLYFVGLILVSSGMSAMFEISLGQVLSISFTTSVLYCGFVSFYVDDSNLKTFAVNSCFLLGASVIDYVRSISITKNAYNKHLMRMELRSEVFNRDKIIHQKTKELLRNELLSQQFSPQILSLVKNGKLKIEDKFHKTLVTVVVVDIVNSTKIMGEIDPDKGNHVIEMIYDIITKTFLKWDLTIEKFTGDGVMAFSNDPINYHDHTYRAVMACKEVKEQVLEHGPYIQKYWGQPLGLRYGIHTGRATIGFVGNGRLRAYAALGVDVNLAHRICSECPANDILLSEESWFSLNTQNTSHPFAVKKSFSAKLKGFENEVAMKVVEADNSLSSETSAELICDLCGSELYISQVRGQAFVTKCRNCDDNKTQVNFTKLPKAA